MKPSTHRKTTEPKIDLDQLTEVILNCQKEGRMNCLSLYDEDVPPDQGLMHLREPNERYASRQEFRLTQEQSLPEMIATAQ